MAARLLLMGLLDAYGDEVQQSTQDWFEKSREQPSRRPDHAELCRMATAVPAGLFANRHCDCENGAVRQRVNSRNRLTGDRGLDYVADVPGSGSPSRLASERAAGRPASRNMSSRTACRLRRRNLTPG